MSNHRKRLPVLFDHTRGKVTLYYDDGCGFCSRVVNYLLAADRAGLITTIGMSDRAAFRHDLGAFDLESSIVVVEGSTGATLTKTRALAAIIKTLPGVYQPFRLAALPGVVAVSDMIYDIVARHRHRISAWLGLQACEIRLKSQS